MGKKRPDYNQKVDGIAHRVIVRTFFFLPKNRFFLVRQGPSRNLTSFLTTRFLEEHSVGALARVLVHKVWG